MKLTPGAVLAALALTVPCSVGFAQPASITGVVRQPDGSVLPGVTVTTVPQSGGLVRHTTSSSDGSYRFDALPDGVYRVDFDLRGFEVVRRNHVRAGSGAGNVDAVLRLRPFCECITPTQRTSWSQRLGQVIDAHGRPLPHARIQVADDAAYTDIEGRFLIRLNVDELQAVTATDTGFRPLTQQASGNDAATLVLSLEFAGTTGVPDVERFGGCDCQRGYLYPYGEP